MTKKANKDRLVNHLLKEAPVEPEPTCPNINELVNLLEILRTTNAELRSSAEHWRKIALLLCEHVPAEKRKSLMKKITETKDPFWGFG